MGLHTVFGAGPIGLSLGRQLLEDGHQVRLVSRRGTNLEGARIYRADAANPAEAFQAANGAEVLYNCTNVPYQDWAEKLPAIFGSILHAAEHAGARLVLLDNLYTYYPVDGPISESSREHPVGHKGKLRFRLAQEYLRADAEGLVKVTIARASDFYGPHMTNVHFGDRILKRLSQGKVMQWIGSPDVPHSFAYREDVARSLAILGGAPHASGRVWIVPHSHVRRPREMMEMAGKMLGKQPHIQSVSEGMLKFAGLFSPLMRELRETFYQFDTTFVADSTAFEKEFGVTATPLEDGLRATVEALGHTREPLAHAY